MGDLRIAARMALQAPAQAGREGMRDAIVVPTTMRALGYHGHDVIVRNISEQGFMAETEAIFPEAAYVRLKLPGLGAVNAQIKWSEGGRLGGQFVTPIATARLAMIVGIGRGEMVRRADTAA